MWKMWQNMKWSTKTALILTIVAVVLVAGWFSDFIPSLVLNSYRSEYTAMAKDPDTGFPSATDRIESNGMGAFMVMAYWYDMAQQKTKAKQCYMEALYRYGWDHPRAPELWRNMMDMNFSGSNADNTERDAISFYWLFAYKYNEQFNKSPDFTPHPQFKAIEPDIAAMIRRRGSRAPLPKAELDYDMESDEVLQQYKDMGVRRFLTDFLYLNREMLINKVDNDAVGEDDPNLYIPVGSRINEFSIANWE